MNVIAAFVSDGSKVETENIQCVQVNCKKTNKQEDNYLSNGISEGIF